MIHAPLARRLARLSAVLLLAAASAQAAPPTSWSIEPLGSLGTRSTYAFGMNSRGEVVGYSYTSTPDPSYGNVFHGFTWDGSAGMRDAGSPGAFSYLTAINDRGTAVGSSNGGVYLYKAGTWTSLGFQGEPVAINKSGSVAGFMYENGNYVGFLYRDGVLHRIGAAGPSATFVNAMNDRDVLAGQSSQRAFVYEKGVMKDLGTLGGPFSAANDINNHGTVVGYSSTGSGQSAFIYEGGVMRAIVSDPGGSLAVAINDRGEVIGQVGNTNSAFLYSGGVVTLLSELQVVKDAGWTTLNVEDINDRGWITGYGYRGGDTQNYQAFVLKPR